MNEGHVEAEAQPGSGPPASAGTRDRIHVLDVLRGIALLGMFLVRFSNFSSGGGGMDAAYQRLVALAFEERFWTMFGMLFGVGFAIQYRRADARGESFVPKYLRRLAGLAGFGFVARGIIGFNVLLSYAIQIVMLGLTFSRYALGVSVTPLAGLVAALALFAVNAAFGRWWLARHPYGPLEWLWRSLTHARWQQWSCRTV